MYFKNKYIYNVFLTHLNFGCRISGRNGNSRLSYHKIVSRNNIWLDICIILLNSFPPRPAKTTPFVF